MTVICRSEISTEQMGILGLEKLCCNRFQLKEQLKQRLA